MFDEYPQVADEQFYLNNENKYEGIRCSTEIEGDLIIIIYSST